MAAGLVTVAAAAAGCEGGATDDVSVVRQPLSTSLGLSADTYVRSGQAGTNFGTSTVLLADGDDAGSDMHTFLKYSIGAVSGPITRVTLRLYVTNATTGPYYVRRVTTNSWSETGVTWSNQPSLSTTNVATIGSTSVGWKDIDVTSVSAANTTTSLAIVPGSNDGIDFSSREASSNRPQIIVEYAGGSNTITTDPGLKIAFAGDTADGANWRSVLTLIKNEGAAAVVTAGDMTYDSDPAGWWSATESVVGTSFPVFLSRGNHDDTSWGGFLGKAANHLGGATRVNGPHDAAYKTLYRGLNLVAVKRGDVGSTITNLFGSDGHIFKVCHWHQNQNKMQVGGKGDEMGWDVYETCRRAGAIIITGHEHTYHRTKTMTNTQNQTVDSSCSSGGTLCVGPGRTFVTVTGLGGTGIRSQVRCTPTASSPPYASLNTSDASCKIWASIFTSNQGANYGAQFITFNVDGNPRKARGYFKTISGQVIDNFEFFVD